jgi:glycosyltransferase involved in cell wall biosynthesis
MDFAPFESAALSDVMLLPGHFPKKAALVLRDFVARWADVRAASDYDAVMLYREAALLGPALYERVLARRRIPFAVDFDDAIWMPNPSINGAFAALRFPTKLATICRIASAVTVGNEFLADYARGFQQNVAIVPTTIDLSKYDVQPELETREPFVVLWSGSTPTLAYFETAREALERFAKTRKVQVKVICNRPPDRPIANADNVFVPWSEHNEARQIGACHVGIMPMPDDKFSQGKCGLKALQYMAVGRASVLTPIGMNKDLVQPGVNGLFANTTAEWVDALSRLADNEALRRSIGESGRKTVEQGFSATVGATKLAAVFNQMIDQRRSRGV